MHSCHLKNWTCPLNLRCHGIEIVQGFSMLVESLSSWSDCFVKIITNKFEPFQRYSFLGKMLMWETRPLLGWRQWCTFRWKLELKRQWWLLNGCSHKTWSEDCWMGWPGDTFESVDGDHGGGRWWYGTLSSTTATLLDDVEATRGKSKLISGTLVPSMQSSNELSCKSWLLTDWQEESTPHWLHS